jgi:hypothetical protein
MHRHISARRIALRALSGLAVPLAVVVGLAAPASAANSSWTESVYHGNGHSLGTAPATVAGSTVSFNFSPDTYAALLTSSDKSLTGDLSNTTVSDTVSVTGMNPSASFVDQNGGGCTPDNQNVRFYFASPSAGGNGNGFFTKYWWSNPVHVQLQNDGAGGVAPTTISVSLADPAQWSDWNGQQGDSSPDVTTAFDSAISKVGTIGLSFGGGCFFENGVSVTSGTATFNSQFSES